MPKEVLQCLWPYVLPNGLITTSLKPLWKQPILLSFKITSLARKESLEASTTTYQGTPPHHYPDMEDTPYSCQYIYNKEWSQPLALFPSWRSDNPK